jgi:polar amino acid transport system substrate-binding protein
MVGFNRRFAPHIQTIKSKLKQMPLSVMYRVNAGFIPADHWTQNLQVGGGRIVGELCHFIDLAIYLAGELPGQINATAIPDSRGLNDTLTCTLDFPNGSIASINYFSNGSKSLPKEYLEVHAHGVSVVLNDFKEMTWFTNKVKKESMLNQDKGHRAEVHAFLDAVKNGQPSPIPFEDVYAASLLPFLVQEALRVRKSVNLNWSELIFPLSSQERGQG